MESHTMRICLHLFQELTAEVKHLRMIDFIHMLDYSEKKKEAKNDSMVINLLNPVKWIKV